LKLLGEIEDFLQSMPCGTVLANTLHEMGLPAHLYLVDCNTAIVPHPLIRPTEPARGPEYYAGIAETGERYGIRIIQVWEDQWYTKRPVIESRIRSIAGETERIFARKTTPAVLSRPEMDTFMERNHLLGTTSARYRYGLMQNNVPVAGASFSKPRNIHRGQKIYRSYEMVRYCSAINTTVVGGLDKLLKHFTRQHEAEHIMTYADRDWGTSQAYAAIGFRQTGKTAPTAFWVEPETLIRIYPGRQKKYIKSKGWLLTEGTTPDKVLEKNGYYKAFNAGSLKYVQFLPD
jgi:hypothetical protein